MTSLRTTHDGSNTLYSPHYQQTYHSIHGAITESQHIFFQESGVLDDLAAGEQLHILEVGFGTGLNCILAAHYASQWQTTLALTSLEKDCLPLNTLRTLQYGEQLMQPELDAALLKGLASLPLEENGRHQTHVANVALTLHVGDAREAPLEPQHYDYIFQDAFSPDHNPELWDHDFFSKLFHHLRPNGTLATYCAKGVVRRTLLSVGFDVYKRPGPPGKREILIAIKPSGHKEA